MLTQFSLCLTHVMDRFDSIAADLSTGGCPRLSFPICQIIIHSVVHCTATIISLSPGPPTTTAAVAAANSDR